LKAFNSLGGSRRHKGGGLRPLHLEQAIREGSIHLEDSIFKGEGFQQKKTKCVVTSEGDVGRDVEEGIKTRFCVLKGPLKKIPERETTTLKEYVNNIDFS